MGLAGTKNRTKISKDPNNNNWAKNTTSFGHKILSSQGWTPGQYLGASDAAHADHYTQANASHIRVLLRDDNLGLGAAKAGAKNAETFGLLQFSGLLGRLNGKDTQVSAKQEAVKRDVQLSMYQDRKYGTMNFVSAGYLVGDKIQESPLEISNEPVQSPPQPSSTTNTKKRKRSDRDTDEQEQTAASTPNGVTKSDAQEPDAANTKKEDKAARRARKEARRLEKQARAEKKEARRKAKKSPKEAEPESNVSSSSSIAVAASGATAAATAAVPDAEEPTAAAVPTTVTITTSTPVVPRPDLSRFAVRKRYIQQKRMAGMDPQAMREIFMIKSA